MHGMPTPAPARTPKPQSSDTADAPGFVQEAVVRVRAVQAAVTEVLAGAGLGGARPTEVGRTLGLDKTLAWKISRFVGDRDPARAARHMPGAGGVEIVLRAAAERGVESARVESAREADRLLRAFVANQAGDQRSFEAMLAAGGRDERLEYEERRAHYRAGAAVWGVRARTQLLTLALRPSESGDDLIDVVQVGGLIDFERLRPEVPWIIRRLRVADDAGRRLEIRREPLDPAGAGSGMALLRAHCSDPLPEIRQFVGSNGWVYDELAAGEVGRKGALTCISGEIYRAALPARRSEDNTEGRYTLTVRTPVEAVVFDLLVHERLSHFAPPRTSVHGLLEDRPRGHGHAVALYEPRAADELGRPAIVQTPRIDGYSALVGEALDRAGWGGLNQFRGYRAELEYPPAPCELMLTCEIREHDPARGSSPISPA